MRNLILSVDKLNTFSTCPRKYYFTHVLNKTLPGRAKYFSEGEFWHKCLEYYYKDKIKLRRQPIQFYVEIANNFAASFEELDQSELQVIIAIFAQYLNYYEDEDWKIEEAEVPFAKVLFEDERADLRVIVRGKADLLLTTKNGSGNRATSDHKFLARFESVTERDNQVLAYSWAFNRRDFYLNKAGKQTSYSADKKFVRDYFCVSENNIQEWIENTIYDSLDIARMYEKDYFPIKYTGCNYRGHKCIFHDLCNLNKENWKYSLETNFVERKEFDLMSSGD